MKSSIAGLSIAVALLLVWAAVTDRAAAAGNLSEWSAPVNLGPIVNSPFSDFAPAVSKNGLSLYFSSDRPGGSGSSDIWVSQRLSSDDPWGVPVNLGSSVNTGFGERAPAFSRDGHWIFFVSERPGGAGGDDIWASWRRHIHDDFGWQPPINLGASVNSATFDAGASFFEDDGGAPLLFFGSTRAGGPGGEDIYVSAMRADGSFGPAALVAGLSSPQADRRPTIRFDGLEIIFFSNRPGTLGGADLWVSSRDTVLDAWPAPVNLGPVVNSASNEGPSYLSGDGLVLYMTSDRPGGSGALDLYVTARERIGRGAR